MKNLISILAIMAIVSCKAQSNVIPMGSNQFCRNNPDCYEKDVNNEFGKFEGTWKYQDGDTEITFKLKKEEHYQTSPDSNYQDLLVGEYQYIENGTEVANTLSDFDDLLIKGYDHKISGSIFTHRLPDQCTDNSNVVEIKVELFINHPTNNDIMGRVILRYVNNLGVEKLEACIYDYTTTGDDANARIDIPDGYYEFIKQ